MDSAIIHSQTVRHLTVATQAATQALDEYDDYKGSSMMLEISGIGETKSGT